MKVNVSGGCKTDIYRLYSRIQAQNNRLNLTKKNVWVYFFIFLTRFIIILQIIL